MYSCHEKGAINGQMIGGEEPSGTLPPWRRGSGESIEVGGALATPWRRSARNSGRLVSLPV
jgi:hypothetical protein